MEWGQAPLEGWLYSEPATGGPGSCTGCEVHISHQPCPGLGEEARDKAAMGTSVSCSAERHAINRREVMSRSSTVHSYGRPGTATSTALTFYNTPIN